MSMQRKWVVKKFETGYSAVSPIKSGGCWFANATDYSLPMGEAVGDSFNANVCMTLAQAHRAAARLNAKSKKAHRAAVRSLNMNMTQRKRMATEYNASFDFS